MSLDFITINGHNPNINYEELERDFRNFFSYNTSNVKMFIINNFPICLSNEISIDLIIILAIKDCKGNYYIAKNTDEGKPIYFHNQIIPISFVNNLNNRTITLDQDDESTLNIDENTSLDYSSEIKSLRQGLQNYLVNRCSFIKEDLFVKPLIFIKNPSNIHLDNYIISNEFNIKTLVAYFRNSNSDIYLSYKYWKESDFYDNNLNFDIQRIVEQASLDAEVGFLTKKKIERLTKQLSSSKKIFDQIGKQMTIISGKAGTGKSSELLLLALKCLKENKNVIYLTYNRLLVNDISLLIKSFINNPEKSTQNNKIGGSSSVHTLHSYFYKLSNDLGVLGILGQERINSVLSTLRFRLNSIFVLIKSNYQNHSFTNKDLKSFIQLSTQIDIGTKEVGIDFINYLIRKKLQNRPDLKEIIKEFYTSREKRLTNIELKDTFLSDYYGVLESLLLQVQDPIEFYSRHDLKTKYEKQGQVESRLIHLKLNQEKFFKKISRKLVSRKSKDIILIDEAQDCHRLEKDILISLYGSEKLVLVNGGKEQLIRHTELCNWKISQGKKIDYKVIKTYNKSLRMKQASVDFCNFLAKKFQIDLDLIPLDSEDNGEIIFDFRKHTDATKIEEVFNELIIKGTINQCSSYESLMILLDSHSQQIRQDTDPKDNTTTTINEFNNIQITSNRRENKWSYKEYFTNHSKNRFDFWDGTVLNKSFLALPTTLENRLIYYESCRGLESWSLACFAIDRFFNFKREEEDAEKFLLENLLLNHDSDLRKSMYAATWVLMALTRVIDTLYIQIEDSNSELSKIILEYIEQNKQNPSIRVLKD
ncbi:UvrD-helicase domain-containing protein [Myroides marinus]|uniref:UvrD-helicase domain-containing protein n=1 Tax=Myroides marinus TaxID=703342 RepID=UPI002574BC66|nr:UvrD-helicase domain-containing protein [Myroides marinus]